jgi:hypothetical protein
VPEEDVLDGDLAPQPPSYQSLKAAVKTGFMSATRAVGPPRDLLSWTAVNTPSEPSREDERVMGMVAAEH